MLGVFATNFRASKGKPHPVSTLSPYCSCAKCTLLCALIARTVHVLTGVLTTPVAEAFTSPVIDLSNLVPSVFSRCHSLYTSEACPHLCFFHALRPLKTRGKNGDNYCSKKPWKSAKMMYAQQVLMGWSIWTDIQTGNNWIDMVFTRAFLNGWFIGCPGSHIKSFQESFTTK